MITLLIKLATFGFGVLYVLKETLQFLASFLTIQKGTQTLGARAVFSAIPLLVTFPHLAGWFFLGGFVLLLLANVVTLLHLSKFALLLLRVAK